MSRFRLYSDLAKYWPLVSPVEDYAEEGAVLRALFREKLGPGHHSLLDLGVGAGHHLFHIAADFEVTAVDRSHDMLAQSRRLNPGVAHHLGDMRTLRLERTFDSVLIHDAISYMLSERDLLAAFETAAVHLRSGGVLVAVPDWFCETFRDQSVAHTTHCSGDTDLTYIEFVHDPDPSDTCVETLMFLLVRRHGQLRVEEDRHMMGLFPQSTWMELLGTAGFKAELRPFGAPGVPAGQSLLVGTRL